MRKAKRQVNRARADKKFVVSVVTRRGLAGELNEYLAEARRSTDHWDAELGAVKRFTPDDGRLTDKVCRSYANMLYRTELFDEYEQDELRSEFLFNLLKSSGRAGRSR